MIFHRPNPRSFVPLCEMADFRRVHSIKLVGVEFNTVLDFSAHISTVVNCCNQRLYLLQQLKRLGLSTENCDAIFKAIVISKFLYALPAFYDTCLRLLRTNCLQFCAKQNGGSLRSKITVWSCWQARKLKGFSKSHLVPGIAYTINIHSRAERQLCYHTSPQRP